MKGRLLLAAGAAIVIAGCGGVGGLTSSTQVTDSQGDATQAYRSIAVVPVDGTSDEGLVFANAIAAQLTARGVVVKADDKFVKSVLTANGSAVMKALKASGADGVLYLYLQRADKTGKGDTSIGAWGWTGQQATWYTAPGNANAAIGRFEARLYDLASGKEVWFGRTMTFYPKAAAVDAPPVAEAVAAELAKHGFIGAKAS
jgi:hypothetical protein